eukprot:1090563-Rhodomonas_salina.3
MPCPVLAYRMLLPRTAYFVMSGTDTVHGCNNLRACYAMSGSDKAYVLQGIAYAVLQGSVLRATSTPSVLPSAASLRAGYAMSSTDLAYNATMCYATSGTDIEHTTTVCYAISGTNLAYAATTAHHSVHI